MSNKTKEKIYTLGIRTHFYKDAVKFSMFLPKLILSTVKFWPKKYNGFTKTLRFVMFISLVLLQLGQLIYFGENIKDATIMASTFSTISTSFQALSKILILIVYNDRLVKIKEILWNEFWPSKFLEEEQEKKLQRKVSSVVHTMIGVFGFAVLYEIAILLVPLRGSVKKLPYECWLPFNGRERWNFGIIYIIESIICVFVIVPCIMGYDFLFITFCVNCAAQFKILGAAMEKIACENQMDINKQISSFTNNGNEEVKGEVPEKELLIKCVDYHNKLIRMCSDIEKVFSFTNFLQLFCTTSALCISSFLLVRTGTSQIVKLLAYGLGHFFQYFIICGAATELTTESEILSINIFNCGWHNERYLKLKKEIQMILLVSQRPRKISVWSVININYILLISIVRLSFSFYTFLSTIVENAH